MIEDAIRNPDISKSVQRFQLAIESAKVRLDLAISPGLWLLPSKMVVNTESVVGYNNKLKKATSFMRIGVNSDLNILVRRFAPKHNFGSGAVKLPHSGVETKETKETRVVKSETKETQPEKQAETKEKQVTKSEASEAKDCFNFARDQFECFDYCRRWVSLASFKMKRREASEAGEACYLVLLTCCCQEVITRARNTGWLNFQKIIHPVFIFNEFATLRLCDFVAIKNLRFRAGI